MLGELPPDYDMRLADDFVENIIMAKANLTFADRRFVSATGTGRYIYLNKPDQFDKHKIEVVFDPKDTEFKQMVADIFAFEKEHGCAKGKAPGCLRKDDDTGNPVIAFKTSPRKDDNGKIIPVKTVGADPRQDFTDTVWPGATVKVSFSLAHWKSTQGEGVKPYLNAVQVLENGEAKSSFGFEIQSDFVMNSADEEGKTDDGFDFDLS